jgi:hypothetical protein
LPLNPHPSSPDRNRCAAQDSRGEFETGTDAIEGHFPEQPETSLLYHGVTMAVWNDLDARAWVLTLLALFLCAAFAISQIRALRFHLPGTTRSQRTVLWFGAFICFAMALTTIKNSSHGERKTVSGQVHIYRDFQQADTPEQMLVCADECGPATPLLFLNADAANAFRSQDADTSVVFGYLDDRSTGSGNIAFTVVDMTNAKTGESFYHLDTDKHSFRAVVLFVDAALLLVVSLFRARSHAEAVVPIAR